jgi:nitrate reductase gamma subunit
MDTQQWLEWLRGTGLQIASMVLVTGLVYRVLHLLLLGRKPNLAVARGSEWRGGLRAVWHRSLPPSRPTSRGYLILGAGYVFHIGFFVALLLLAQHIALFRSVLGFGWPALSPMWVTIAAVLSIAAMIALLVQRTIDPVKRLLTNFQDYLTWALTFLPLLTGLILRQSGGGSYQLMLALHIASVELLMIVTPFTKLAHMGSLFVARWYNGAIAGYKGVDV